MQKVLIWLTAFVITLATAYYQRITGPTYPIKDKVLFEQSEINYTLARSHGGIEDHNLVIESQDSTFNMILFWKPLNYPGEWNQEKLDYNKGVYSAVIPNPNVLAAKIEYYVEISKKQNKIQLPLDDDFVVIRFKGDVPLLILIPHVIAMFGAMLLATRTGIEALLKRKNVAKLTYWTMGLLVICGFILGPLIQQYAFGALWTGFPFGYDLTDNKTLIALIGWLIALLMIEKKQNPNFWVLAASIIMLVIFLIPHSLLGSEADYKEINKQQIESTIE